jgi:hypothetical protein
MRATKVIAALAAALALFACAGGGAAGAPSTRARVVEPHDAGGLLAQYAPVLRYDARELFYADSPGIATDNPQATLRAGAPSGPVVASGRGHTRLSLSYLGGKRYADGRPVGRGDTGTGPSGGRAAAAGLAMQMHAQPRYANVVYGHLAHGSDGRWWLQYWLFFMYNHAPYGDGIGDHWGDWKVLQLRLDDVPRVVPNGVSEI